jgi:hypothetical protein
LTGGAEARADRLAIGARGPASEVLHVKSRHWFLVYCEAAESRGRGNEGTRNRDAGTLRCLAWPGA